MPASVVVPIRDDVEQFLLFLVKWWCSVMSISDDDVMTIHITLFQSCDDVIPDEGPRRRYFFPPTCHHVSVRDFGSRLITIPRDRFKPLGQSTSASSASAFVLRAPASSAPARAPDFIRSRHDVYLHPFSASCTCQCCNNVIQWWCMMMSNVCYLLMMYIQFFFFFHLWLCNEK